MICRIPMRVPFVLSSALAIVLVAADAPLDASGQALAHAPAASSATEQTTRRYGAGVKLGDGLARAYVTYDETGSTPVEIGVALDERALEGLPSSGSGHHDGTGATHTFLLDLPAQYTPPFKFVELNWNPAGHEPEGVYQDVPHFDFHFYTITKAEREAIVPTDPRFAVKANHVPASDFVPPFTVPLGPPDAPPAAVAVPLMGVHWSDVRSPELQGLLGKPEAYRPFTATFIHGSWDGRFTFWEPMITRAHIIAKKDTSDPAVRDEIIPISTPARYQAPGHYPRAYRITWDAEAKEYRIALTQLTRQG